MAVATATAQRTDAQIQTDVLSELKWEPRVSSNEIGVIVKDGVVTLTGWVDSYMKRWAAEDAAHHHGQAIHRAVAVGSEEQNRAGPRAQRRARREAHHR